MTAHTELRLRARAKAHDITSPVAGTDAALTGTVTTGQDVAERAVGRVVRQIAVPADAAASTTIAESPVLSVPSSTYPNGAKIVEISRRDAVAVTADDSDYGTDAFVCRDYLGVNNTTAATVTSQITGGSGDTVAQKKVALTLGTVANCTVPPDGCVTLTRTKTGVTGVQFPDQLYTVVLEAL